MEITEDDANRAVCPRCGSYFVELVDGQLTCTDCQFSGAAEIGDGAVVQAPPATGSGAANPPIG